MVVYSYKSQPATARVKLKFQLKVSLFLSQYTCDGSTINYFGSSEIFYLLEQD